jgi:hypothetical protein
MAKQYNFKLKKVTTFDKYGEHELDKVIGQVKYTCEVVEDGKLLGVTEHYGSLMRSESIVKEDGTIEFTEPKIHVDPDNFVELDQLTDEQILAMVLPSDEKPEAVESQVIPAPTKEDGSPVVDADGNIMEGVEIEGYQPPSLMDLLKASIDERLSQ